MNTPLRMLSLCTGIGGIDLAAVWAGFEIAGQVEINPYCRAVLEKHDDLWPDVVRMNDIREVQGNEFGAVDLVAGGIPCQPFSIAGKRKGTLDNRHLWPEMLRIVEAIQPAWVLIENVAEFVNLALDLVQSDLEARGYEIRAFVVPASAIGAPHKRERIFVVANLSRVGSNAWGTKPEGQQRTPNAHSNGPEELMANAASREHPRSWVAWTGRAELTNSSENVAYSRGSGQQECEPTSIASEQSHSTWRNLAPGTVANAPSRREREHRSPIREGRPQSLTQQPGTGDTQSAMGRGVDGLSARLDAHRWPTLPGQEQGEWEPPRTVAKRLPYCNGYRNRRLEALGNAVVPQQVLPFLLGIAAIQADCGVAV